MAISRETPIDGTDKVGVQVQWLGRASKSHAKMPKSACPNCSIVDYPANINKSTASRLQTNEFLSRTHTREWVRSMPRTPLTKHCSKANGDAFIVHDVTFYAYDRSRFFSKLLLNMVSTLFTGLPSKKLAFVPIEMAEIHKNCWKMTKK